jgi:hypothetical protein
MAAFPCDSLDTRVPGTTFTCVLSSRESSEFHTLQFEHLQTRLQDRDRCLAEMGDPRQT